MMTSLYKCNWCGMYIYIVILHYLHLFGDNVCILNLHLEQNTFVCNILDDDIPKNIALPKQIQHHAWLKYKAMTLNSNMPQLMIKPSLKLHYCGVTTVPVYSYENHTKLQPK